ncbi:sensor histidine kinase [Halomicrococcus sp. NG-SE-24]|uniref:sensor histidine kinase n=1 Tax=Halomicrococcus sp. NG-SE-24 TaxID=3436928 RepID=UPI003D9769E9
MLAHERRNPVTIGQMYCHELPDEANSDAVEHVREAFDRIDAMIDVRLALTRGHEAVGERTTVSLADVAREAWDEVETPDATVDIDVDRTIQADETYIRHLFQNLFENAVEHGGADVDVAVGELPTGFYVADDGPGIPADDRDAVFEAGFTTAAEKGGTVVGLAFVQKLTEVYGWESRATESAAGGSRFEFTNVDEDAPRD